MNTFKTIKQKLLLYQELQLIIPIALLLLIQACNTKEPLITPTPPPVGPTENGDIIGKFEKIEVIDFLQLTHDSPTITLAEDQIEEHFGNRVQHYIPIQLDVQGDSTYFLKNFGLTDKYRSKWEKNNLLLREANNDYWFICGEKTDTSTFRLHINFFSKLQNRPGSTNLLLGQDMKVASPNDLITEADSAYNLTWLNVHVYYTLNKTQ